MKALLSNIILVCTIAIIAISCSSGAGTTPSKTAVRYAEAYYNWDLKTCRKLMGNFYEDSDLQYEQSLMNEEKNTALRKILKKHKYSVKYDPSQSEIQDETATIILEIKTDLDKNLTETGSVLLKKVDGHWYVERMRAFLHPKSREEAMSIMQ